MEQIQTKTPAPLVKEIDTHGFITDALKGSHDVPVLVDFWAPWCGTCKQLAPVLEKVVTSYKGKVRLVKLNIDENQQVAAQMGIQSIPAVFAFYKGQPIDGFMGAPTEGAIRTFIEALLKISGGHLPGVDEILAQANEALSSGNIEEANDLFSVILEQDPVNAPAHAGMIKIALLAGEVDEARAMLDEAPKEIATAKELASLRAQIELMTQTSKVDAAEMDEARLQLDKTPNDHQTRYDYALALYGTGGDHNIEAAIDQLVEIVRRDRQWNDDAARKQLVKIFEALGFMHPLSVDGRRKLSSVLFS